MQVRVVARLVMACLQAGPGATPTSTVRPRLCDETWTPPVEHLLAQSARSILRRGAIAAHELAGPGALGKSDPGKEVFCGLALADPRQAAARIRPRRGHHDAAAVRHVARVDFVLP